MKQGWKYKDFEDCLEKVVYTTKILSKDYLSDGEYPIVSQEEGLISGYWNKREDLFQLKKPVVLFGDHTRVLKYVDFDFVIGADGVKILQPIEQLFAKFLYYFLQWYKVPSLGYSRHYKLLKEITVPIPPIEEQKEICSLLDKMNRVIEAKKEQLKELDNLAQSLFYELFGDPEENNKGWKTLALGDACTLKAGKSIKASELSETINGNLFPCYGGNGIRGYIDKFSHNIPLPIIGRQGALCGNVNYAKAPFYATEHAVVVTPKTTIEVVWLYYVLKLMHLNQYAHGVAQPGLSVQDIEPLPLIIPPLPLQQSFAEKVEAIERQKELINQSIKDVQTLFDAKMDNYFGD